MNTSRLRSVMNVRVEVSDVAKNVTLALMLVLALGLGLWLWFTSSALEDARRDLARCQRELERCEFRSSYFNDHEH